MLDTRGPFVYPWLIVEKKTPSLYIIRGGALRAGLSGTSSPQRSRRLALAGQSDVNYLASQTFDEKNFWLDSGTPLTWSTRVFRVWTALYMCQRVELGM